MLGSSRDSLAALRSSLDARSGEPGFDSVSADLLAVAGVLGTEKSLRQALADAGQPVAARAGIATSLFGAQIAPESMAVLVDVVSARWSNGTDLVDAVENLGEQAAFIVAERNGSLERVEGELFRYGRAVDASPELQLALTDPAIPGGRKAALVADLVGGGAAPETTALLTYLAGNLRGRRPVDAVEALTSLAAAQRDRVVAEVRSAIALTPEQESRLAAALTRLQGREVRVNVIVDPAVVGGVVVQVGDEVIDGSVANRLEQARRAVTA
jgi:F-type H+-transporting ATPase subunit delta